jgi:hypothetical protein
LKSAVDLSGPREIFLFEAGATYFIGKEVLFDKYEGSKGF